MSTAGVSPSAMYPLRFEFTGGPTFARIADSAKYYHDRHFDMPLSFTGVLTDTTTGKSRNVKLRAYAYGYWAGTDFKDGWVTIYLNLPGYICRFGPALTYNCRDPKKTGAILELAESSKGRPTTPPKTR